MFRLYCSFPTLIATVVLAIARSAMFALQPVYWLVSPLKWAWTEAFVKPFAVRQHQTTWAIPSSAPSFARARSFINRRLSRMSESRRNAPLGPVSAGLAFA